MCHIDHIAEELLTTVRNYADRAHGEQTRKYTAEQLDKEAPLLHEKALSVINAEIKQLHAK